MISYKMGKLSQLVLITSLVAVSQVRSGLFAELPVLFWIVQVNFFAWILFGLKKTIVEWDDAYAKKILVRSLCMWCLMYALAWSSVLYAWAIVAVVGILDIVLTRKCFGYSM